MQNNLLAAMGIVLILGTFIWALVVFWAHAHWIVYANISYLLWAPLQPHCNFPSTT